MFLIPPLHLPFDEYNGSLFGNQLFQNGLQHGVLFLKLCTDRALHRGLELALTCNVSAEAEPKERMGSHCKKGKV